MSEDQLDTEAIKARVRLSGAIDKFADGVYGVFSHGLVKTGTVMAALGFGVPLAARAAGAMYSAFTGDSPVHEEIYQGLEMFIGQHTIHDGAEVAGAVAAGAYGLHQASKIDDKETRALSQTAVVAGTAAAVGYVETDVQMVAEYVGNSPVANAAKTAGVGLGALVLGSFARGLRRSGKRRNGTPTASK